MENNQLVLDLETYNRLRDFNIKILDGEVLRYYDPDGYREEEVGFITTDRAIKELIGNNKILNSRILELDHTIWKLKNPEKVMIHDPNELLKKVYKMTVWEFIKWRRK